MVNYQNHQIQATTTIKTWATGDSLLGTKIIMVDTLAPCIFPEIKKTLLEHERRASFDEYVVAVDVLM